MTSLVLLKNFILYVKNQFENIVKIIRTENDAKFAMKNFFSSKIIISQTTWVKISKQDGIVEKKHEYYRSRVLNFISCENIFSKNIFIKYRFFTY